VQETALNHVMCSGLAGDGFGATRQMSLRKLIWVVTRINIQVDKYSRWYVTTEIEHRSWLIVISGLMFTDGSRIFLLPEHHRGDVVEIDTWVASSGKNGMRRDWIIRDRNTKNMIAGATR
jgi:fatty acyl-ACP thioesterase B